MLGFGSGTRNIPSVAEAAKFKKAQDFLTRPSASLLIKLKAGEQMSYCQVGDSTGIPVVWFAGPNSNRFVVGLYEAVCLEMGIRLLCFDRPGRGASTALRYPKEWTFGSWAPYLDEATDILGISKFYVVAHSLGSSYALACYDKLKHKIIGSVHILACWAHSNLPCMPVSYALQRSVPTGVLRRFIKYFTRASGALTFMPTQMGSVGYREKLIGQDVHVREILDCMQDEVSTEDYAAYELDWMVALEIRHPFAFSHRALKCAVKCWHGMDDDVCPLGVAMWMQREMSQFLLFAVEGATHNIHLDFSIVKALFADICAEAMTAKQALQPVVTKKSKKIPKEKKEDSVESESPDEEKREDFVETESPDATRVNSIDSQASHISGTTPVNGTNTLAPPKDLEGSAVWA